MEQQPQVEGQEGYEEEEMVRSLSFSFRGRLATPVV